MAEASSATLFLNLLQCNGDIHAFTSEPRKAQQIQYRAMHGNKQRWHAQHVVKRIAPTKFTKRTCMAIAASATSSKVRYGYCQTGSLISYKVRPREFRPHMIWHSSGDLCALCCRASWMARVELAVHIATRQLPPSLRDDPLLDVSGAHGSGR